MLAGELRSAAYCLPSPLSVSTIPTELSDAFAVAVCHVLLLLLLLLYLHRLSVVILLFGVVIIVWVEPTIRTTCHLTDIWQTPLLSTLHTCEVNCILYCMGEEPSIPFSPFIDVIAHLPYSPLVIVLSARHFICVHDALPASSTGSNHICPVVLPWRLLSLGASGISPLVVS